MKQLKLKASKDHTSLLQERTLLVEQMMSLTGLMRGSVFSRFSTCSRPSCSCHKGKRHGPRSYFVTTEHKRQRQHYVPNEHVESVKSGVKQFNDLLLLVDKITAINLKLMRHYSSND
jgi:hypothetical protein